MLRPNRWIFALSATVATLVLVLAPEARTRESDPIAALPTIPRTSFILNGCVSTSTREALEDGDCLQAARIDLLTGQITVGQALYRLEACAADRPELAELAGRYSELARDRLRAQIAFGEAITWSTTALSDQEQRAIRDEATRIPAAAVERLREAGITPAGLDASREAGVVRRLANEPGLRSAFRDVFGDRLADDLDALLSKGAAGYPAAVAIGSTVLVPNLPDPNATPETLNPTDGEPLIIDGDAYRSRVVAELRGLEGSRIRFLQSAGFVQHQVGSVRAFLTSVRTRGEDDGISEVALREAELDRTMMLARLSRLERRLGLDPLLYRAAEESVGTAAAIEDRCEAAAVNRQRWVRRGAGAVTGLLGAAGVVVASGATGTLAGGVTIAAALEATVGAYLIAKTERYSPGGTVPGRLASLLPTDQQEDEFRRPDRDIEMDEGESGSGGGEYEEWFEDEGLPWEWDGLEGEGVEEESDEVTDEAPQENTIAPILPVAAPEELNELPPLLENTEIRELAELSLPEIQERLERFLAVRNTEVWADLVEDEEELAPSSIEEMIREAQSALRLWERERVLSERFGAFFIEAELEQVAPRQRPEVHARALGRYTYDRELYRESRTVEDLRHHVAQRLVAHCRAGRASGDLVLSACTDETALSIIIIAAIRDAGISPPPGSVLGVQAYGRRFEAVLYDQFANRVYSLTNGTITEGVIAPIFYPATFYYTYLVSHNVIPDIDSDEHLLIALPNRAMPEGYEGEECKDTRNVVRKAVEWVVSLVGIVSLNSNPCIGPPGSSDGGEEQDKDGGADINIAMPMPQNPFQRGGGQSGGGTGGGSGSGGGQSLTAAGRSAESGEGSQSGSEAGGSSEKGGGQQGGQAGGDAGQGQSPAGTGTGSANQESESARFASGRNGEDSQAGANGGIIRSTTSSSGSGGSGGYSAGNVSLAGGPDLTDIARDASVMISRFQRSMNEGVAPWRLREDEGMMTGSLTRVLYADNEKALARFEEHDRFITLTPADVEAQRRMLEADSYIIYPPETDCDAIGLPPRRVFRRMAPGDPGYRYVFCDHDESKVVFREQSDAETYANYIPPDRPLYLSSLATERLERFDSSIEVQRLRAFLEDPNVVRGFSKEELYAMVKAAADLLVFQNALQSALIQSMNELGNSSLKTYYFDMHRQVLQAPLFIEMAQAVYRLNQRLASDPLQSLAWANAQPDVARRGFFDLYHTLGGMMEWPDRWATMQARYGNVTSTAPTRNPNAPSLDFLQILSDPTRVQIDWYDERISRASISDTQMQDGLERTTKYLPNPTTSKILDRQEQDEHQRGGTSGLGRAGEGESLGPERGRRPLQMMYVRVTPDNGEPDRRRAPEDNQVKPGGTEGEKRTQTEESATRQEPILWVKPTTFIDAILSTWDNDYPKPQDATRIPPILRFNQSLRELFLRDLHPLGIYDNRLRTAMGVFTAGEWLEYEEVREALGGDIVSVRARDTGKFSAAYSGNPPINDQDQIRLPNFFTRTGVVIPEDLFEPVRKHYTTAILGIFDLTRMDRENDAGSIASLPLPDTEGASAGRSTLLRSLDLIRQQAMEEP